MRKIYAVRDLKAECFFPQVLVFGARGEAVREFQTASNTPESPMCKYPSDYVLYEIGEYDEINGLVIPCEQVNLGSAASYKVGPKLVEDNNVRAG